MPKKKQSKIEEQTNIVIEEKPKDPEPIYLVDTLIKLEEIEKYGLNQYFIHAILPNKTYTLSEAKSRIEAYLSDPNK